MTALATELHSILSSANAPMKADSLGRVLHVTGYVGSKGDPIPIDQIDAALEELTVAGRIEKVWRCGAATYRAMPVTFQTEEEVKHEADSDARQRRHDC